MDTDDAETMWGCYAWPHRYGRTGRRTFFINQAGVVTATKSRAYSGEGVFDVVNAGSAISADSPGITYLSAITGEQAMGAVGQDGNVWVPVE